MKIFMTIPKLYILRIVTEEIRTCALKDPQLLI